MKLRKLIVFLQEIEAKNGDVEVVVNYMGASQLGFEPVTPRKRLISLSKNYEDSCGYNGKYTDHGEKEIKAVLLDW